MAASPYTLTPIAATYQSGHAPHLSGDSAMVVLQSLGTWHCVACLTLDEARELAAALLATAAKAEALPVKVVK